MSEETTEEESALNLWFESDHKMPDIPLFYGHYKCLSYLINYCQEGAGIEGEAVQTPQGMEPHWPLS